LPIQALREIAERENRPLFLGWVETTISKVVEIAVEHNGGACPASTAERSPSHDLRLAGWQGPVRFYAILSSETTVRLYTVEDMARALPAFGFVF
jgi:hypothetical protein